MNQSRYILLTLASLALLTAGCKEKKVQTAAEAIPAIPVEAQTISESTVTDTIVSSAPVAAIADIFIVSRSQGTIQSAPMKNGMSVQKGTTLIAVENDAQKASVDQATSGVAQAQLAYDVAKAMFDKGNGSRSELIGTETGLAAAKSGLAMAQLMLDKCKTVSPIAGVVTSVENSVQTGASVSPGSPLGRIPARGTSRHEVLGRIVDISRVKHTVYVGENQVGAVSVGDKASIFVAASKTTLYGSVTAVAAAASLASGAFAVEITAPNTTSRSVKAGMSGVASIVTKKSIRGLVIPAAVVTVRNNESFVWQLVGETASLTPVQVQPLGGGRMLALSGLVAGDKVITTGLPQLTQGCSVTATLSGGDQ